MNTTLDDAVVNVTYVSRLHLLHPDIVLDVPKLKDLMYVLIVLLLSSTRVCSFALLLLICLFELRLCCDSCARVAHRIGEKQQLC